mmetsp:Transcript_5019/g.10033  ORF Transcript_5019/g.10033 Transcript_5019/m.10033 type:complete len:254 (-) Transcript_5019:240-1001(-)
MFTIKQAIQMPAMSFVNWPLNLSSFSLRGVLVSSSLASSTLIDIFPISVFSPVLVAIATQLPAVIKVPEKSMLDWNWRGGGTGAGGKSEVDFSTVSGSPVRAASSAPSLPPLILITLQSAGTLSPVLRRMTSPGTMEEAGTSLTMLPNLTRVAVEGLSFLSALTLLSAFICILMLTKAFIARMATMTSGSMKDFKGLTGVSGWFFFCSQTSKQEKPPEMTATTNKICTRGSLNSSAMRRQMLFVLGSGSTLSP